MVSPDLIKDLSGKEPTDHPLFSLGGLRVTPVSCLGIDRDAARRRFFEQMVCVRIFEERLYDLFSKGLLFGTTHGYIGQEAVGVGVLNALSEEDIVFSNHRGHGHYLAYSEDIRGLMGELMGKATGCCGGRGGSQHLHRGNFYSNGVQGGIVPVATGMGFAEKICGSGRVAVVFLGDGTLGQGAVYESFNIASLWGIPIVYVVENNRYAMSTSVEEAVAGDMVARGRAFGIESEEFESNDVEIIYDRFLQIVDRVRSQSRPFFSVIHTYRLCGHSKSDDRSYRSKSEEESWAAQDPLLILGQRLEAGERDRIKNRYVDTIERAVEDAKQAPFPTPDSLDT